MDKGGQKLAKSCGRLLWMANTNASVTFTIRS